MHWMLEPLTLKTGAHDRVAEAHARVHFGTARALLGPRLQTTPFDLHKLVDASPFAQWEKFRSDVLTRLRQRGVCGLRHLRKALWVKALVNNVPSMSWPWKEGDPEPLPYGNAGGAGEAEVCLLSESSIAAVFWHDIGVPMNANLASLVTKAFAVEGNPQNLIDANHLVDSIRGHATPGRHTYLTRLYENLQHEAQAYGVKKGEGLPMSWITDRVSCKELFEVRSGHMPEREMWTILMASLPLVRQEEMVSKETFIRFNEDLAHHQDRHLPDFVSMMEGLWGCKVYASPGEELAWGEGLSNTRSRPLNSDKYHIVS
jgi:hypothetical protein